MNQGSLTDGLSGACVGMRPSVAVLAVLALCGQIAGEAAPPVAAARTQIDAPLLVTQLPVGAEAGLPGDWGALRSCYGTGARILLVGPDSSTRVVSRGFHSACDPAVSFDARRILFAGKRRPSDNWNIYEMDLDGGRVRQITRDFGDCRSPCYQSMLYTIVSPKPWYQITFVGNAAGTMEENGGTVATNLYSCKLDGSAVRRLTFNLSSDLDPLLMSDGRLLLASRQRSSLRRGTAGRVALFGINLDGADYALFADPRGRRVKHMPCVTTGGLLVFVEADRVPWDGAGLLSCVRIRRPLQSYRPITREQDGLFHTPSPLPDGSILVSRRPRDGSRTHGVHRFDLASGKLETVFDDPDYHDVQAKIVRARPLPDGRSSVVTETDPHGKLYCLNVYTSDFKQRDWMPSAAVKRLRVLEGIPPRAEAIGADLPSVESLPSRRQGSTINGLPPLAQRRVLGEIDVERNGSFNIEVPANTPLELQILDADGMALRSCSWIWAKNHEPRGCVGCHEDGELTPENLFVDAMNRSSTSLCPPPDRRRTVDFRRDVMPIIRRKCVACHGPGQAPPRLDGGMTPVVHRDGKACFNRAYESLLAVEGSDQETFHGKYVQPGSARTSPLIWHLFGRNTSRPWDTVAAAGPVKQIPPGDVEPLDENERRTFVEWVDLGALWDGIPGPDDLSRAISTDGGPAK